MPDIKSRSRPSTFLPIHYSQVTHHAAVYSASISHFATYILPACPKVQPVHQSGQPVNDSVRWDTSRYAADRRHLPRLQLHSQLTVRQKNTNIHTLQFRLRHSNRHPDFNGTQTDTRTSMEREFPLP